MSTSQRGLVQCPKCKKWFIINMATGKHSFVSLEMLASWEAVLAGECKRRKHPGRRLLK